MCAFIYKMGIIIVPTSGVLGYGFCEWTLIMAPTRGVNGRWQSSTNSGCCLLPFTLTILIHSGLWMIIIKPHLITALDSFHRTDFIFIIYLSLITNLGGFIFPILQRTLRLREVK